jgi:hypothetical protein
MTRETACRGHGALRQAVPRQGRANICRLDNRGVLTG